MRIRSLVAAFALSIMLIAGQATTASATTAAKLDPVVANNLAQLKSYVKAHASADRVHSAATRSITDPTGDADSPYDITSTNVNFDLNTITVRITTAVAVDPWHDSGWGSGDLIVGAFLEFNHVPDTNSMIAVTGSHGSIFTVGINSEGDECDVTGSADVATKTITLTAQSACFNHPGAISYGVALGNNAAYAKGDDRAVDSAPDEGSSDYVSEPGGYWLLGVDGGVFSFGDASFYGSMGSTKLNAPVISMASASGGHGYRFVALDGGIFAFGDASFYGSMGGKPLNKPVVAMTNSRGGNGYYLVASDGGIFAFGDAPFYGSMGGKPLNKPIVSMSVTPSGLGYWLVASDGGMFAFGDAQFFGSMGGLRLASPITAMSPSPTGSGYLLLASDGGIFAFGDAHFYGSGVRDIAGPAVAITVANGGYRITDAAGGVWEYGQMYHFGDLLDLGVTPNGQIISAASTS